MHQCGNNRRNTSRISIIDNYKTQLQFSRPWQDNYITTRSREINDINNVSETYIDSDGTCIRSSSRRDDVIGEITHDATGDLTPGQIITFTVPWTVFSSEINGYH